jgi:hypothetical protein
VAAQGPPGTLSRKTIAVVADSQARETRRRRDQANFASQCRYYDIQSQSSRKTPTQSSATTSSGLAPNHKQFPVRQVYATALPHWSQEAGLAFLDAGMLSG